jgi:hypothetical protein
MFSSLVSQYRKAKSRYGASDWKPSEEPQIAPTRTSKLCKQCQNILREFVMPTKDSWAKYWEFGKDVSLAFTQEEECHLSVIVIDAIPHSYMDKLHIYKKLRFRFVEARAVINLPTGCCSVIL